MYYSSITVVVGDNLSAKLGLPLLRGNPFDLRPIESGRAEYLVGRDRLISSWREHIVSQSPRMLLLVGERGSGRSSVVRTLTSQTRRSFVGQYWPMENPVNSIIHELSIHFCGFSSSGSNQKMIDDLVSKLEEESGSLPVISLDYPPNVKIAPVLNSISPILQRLRALVIVVLTPSQLSSLDDDTIDLFDKPEYTTKLSKKQIQELSNKLVSRKAREKWIIDENLLTRIHESTDGNPRDVIRLLRDLTDERRDVAAHGTLERLMRWQINHNVEESEIPGKEVMEESSATEQSIDLSDEEIFLEEESIILDQKTLFHDEDIGLESADNKYSDIEKEEEYEDVSFDLLESEDPVDLWSDENEPIEKIQESEDKSEEQGTLDDFIYMKPGTEPPMFNSGSGFKGLARRSKAAQSLQPNEPEETPFIESVSQINPPMWDDSEEQIEEDPKVELPSRNSENSMEYEGDDNADIARSSVISTDSAHWSVESSMESSLPKFEDTNVPTADPPFGIEDSPPPPMVALEERALPPSPSRYHPQISWEPDNPLDENKEIYLNEAELLVISIASKREISPSDAELQARLEVGRPRLSQIYNGLHKSGFLSVRKQGRKRLFRITESARKLVEA